MYEELTGNLRAQATHFSVHDETSLLLLKAADAIEELQGAKCPHYIRNVHDRGDDSLCNKWMCEIASLPKWIPVTERLPKENGDYLTFSVGGTWNQLSSLGTAFWDGKNFYTDGFTTTHWMPLPQPPESEGE